MYITAVCLAAKSDGKHLRFLPECRQIVTQRNVMDMTITLPAMATTTTTVSVSFEFIRDKLWWWPSILCARIRTIHLVSSLSSSPNFRLNWFFSFCSAWLELIFPFPFISIKLAMCVCVHCWLEDLFFPVACSLAFCNRICWNGINAWSIPWMVNFFSYGVCAYYSSGMDIHLPGAFVFIEWQSPYRSFAHGANILCESHNTLAASELWWKMIGHTGSS